jgi:putative FmdB family regulatory protein
LPTYEYRCKECGHEFETVQAFTDAALTECPECHGALRKVFGNVGIAFKGSGFYKNDSRAGSSTKSSSESSSSSKDSDSGSSSSSSSSSEGSGKDSSDKKSSGESKPSPEPKKAAAKESKPSPKTSTPA